MARSPEYPDLPWVAAGAWSTGRPYGPPLWIVVHTTEGSEGLRSAEDGAAYDAHRPDGTSTHYMHDQDTTIQEVRTTDRANSAMGTGNRYGIHHELCGKAAQSPAQWHDAASAGTLARFARQAARDAKKWDIPVRHLTVAEVRSKSARGFCAHADITAAFGESTHQDPGANYPWSEVLGMVRAEMEDDVTKEDVKAAIVELLADAEAAAVDGSQPGVTQLGRSVRNSLWKIGERSSNTVLAAVAGVDEAVMAKLTDPATPDEQVAAALGQLLGSRKDAVVALMR